MNDGLFNSAFEMKLRLIQLLSVSGKTALSLDRMVAFDFITCYAAEFDLPFENLHGLNGFKFSEISNRRLLAQQAAKLLVTEGLVEVTVKQGYLFSLSETGIKYAKKFKSRYAVSYRKISREVIKKYKSNTDDGLFMLMQQRALNTTKG